MASVQIDSFISKFKQLCYAGIAANLNIESINGKAIVCLKAEVSVEFFHSVPLATLVKPRSQAYYRRQTQREASRTGSISKNEKAELASTGYQKAVKSKESDIITTSESDEAETSIGPNSDKITEACGNSLGNAEIRSDKVGNGLGISFIKSDLCNGDNTENSSENTCEVGNLNTAVLNVEVSDANSSNRIVSSSSETNTEECNLSDESSIYATASLLNASACQVDNECLTSIFEIIASKDHLQKNITDVKVGNIRNKKSRDGKLMHEVDLIVQVTG